MKIAFVVVVPSLRVSGMAIFPFIFVKNELFKKDAVLIRHETIHLYQELELLVIPFYLLYLTNYLVNRLRYKNHYDAYYNIIFEKEAYAGETQPDYLKKRKLWSWFKFATVNK